MIEERDRSFIPFECTGGNGLKIRGVFHTGHASSSPCVVACHGFTGSHLGPGYLFVKLSRALAAAGYSSLRFDFRGAGESEGLFRDMNTTTMMEDLSTVTDMIRQQYVPSKCIMLGHSFGGMVAARCAGRCDADGLILLSPVGDPGSIAKRREALVTAGPNADGNYENGPHEMSLTFLNHLKGYDPVHELCDTFHGPLLLMQGDADPSISTTESYRYVEQGRKASLDVEYHLLEHADHNYYKVSDVNKVISTTVSWVKEHFGE